MNKLFFIGLAIVPAFCSVQTNAGTCRGGPVLATGTGNTNYSTSATSPDVGYVVESEAQHNLYCAADQRDHYANKYFTNVFYGVNPNAYRCSNGIMYSKQYPGVQWILDSALLQCEGENRIKQMTAVYPTNNAYGQEGIHFGGTKFGSARLQITDDFWVNRESSPNSEILLESPFYAVLDADSRVSIVTIKNPSLIKINIHDDGVCRINAPESIDFGNISPLDISKGLAKNIDLSINCDNRALSVSGLKIRYIASNPLDAGTGRFSSDIKENKKLNFQLIRNGQPVHLDSDIALTSRIPDRVKVIQEQVAVKVLDSQPYPSGAVTARLIVQATYL